MVKVVPVDTNLTRQRRSGFLLGQFEIPDDFDTMGSQEIAALFAAGE
jgi:hypothetical protein